MTEQRVIETDEAARLGRVADRIKVQGVGLIGIGKTASNLDELYREVRGQIAVLEAILWPLEQERRLRAG